MMFYPVFFCSIIGLFFLAFKSKINYIHICIFSFLILIVLSRFLYPRELSHRYVCILIVPGIMFASYLFLKLYERLKIVNFHPRIIVLCLLSICVVIQIVKTFHSDTHKDVIKLKKEISRIQKNNPGAAFYITRKERKRLGGNFYPFVYILDDTGNNDHVSKILEQYRYWGKPVYFVITENHQNSFLSSAELKIPSGTSFDIKNTYYTSKSKKKRLSLYCYTDNEASSDSFSLNDKDFHNSLIKNGSMEEILNHEDMKKRLRNWIKNGASFYDSDSIELPVHEILLPVWKLMKDYPQVFLDPKNPIDGQYSLHLRLNYDDSIYFMQTIPACSGRLSFSIRNCGKSLFVTLTRYDYSENGKISYPDMLYNFYFDDQDIHRITIDVDKNSFLGHKTLFILTNKGQDGDFLIDDIIFTRSDESRHDEKK